MPEKLQIDFRYNSEMHEGTVNDLSCNGLHIDAVVCPPFGSNIEVVLVLGDEVYKLAGKVIRSLCTEKSNCRIGVELLAHYENYCDFVAIVKEFFYRKKFQ